MENYFKFKVIELDRDEISKIKKAWENAFVPVGLDREKIHYDCMHWHIFSYKVKECEAGENKSFNWTFVQTHEDEWLGPYFCRSHS